MTLTLERKIALGFGAAIGVMLLVMGAAWWTVARFGGTYYWVDHTRQVLNQLEQTRAAILGMQSSSRGFVLTGSEDVLRPFMNAIPRLETAMEQLQQMTADSAKQQELLRRLEPLVARARTLMEQRIAARRARGLDAAEETDAYLLGQRSVDAITAVIQEMIAHEQKLLDDRLSRARSFGRYTVLTVVSAGILALGVLAVAAAKVFRDLRHRYAAEEERDRFFTVSRDLLCVATPDGYFKRVNPAWQAVLGLPPEDIVSRPFLEFVHPDDREATLAESARLARGDESIDFENRYRAHDGSYRWLHWSSRRAPNGGLIYASARDVTERKEAEERIRNLNASLAQRAEQLESANRELESFSYSVSHDLRAPLRHIDGFSNLLGKHLGSKADADTRRFIDTISRSAKRMGALIDDLLAFSRIGRVALRISPVDQNRLVAEVIQEGHFDKAGPAPKWEIAPLPVVEADGPMLRQVWANLIGNAVKYSSNAAEPRIAIGTQRSVNAAEHVFFVRDNGVGFDMAYVEKLFGVFQRLHDAAEFEGTGIGLANVRRIVTRLGGRTWAEGRVGEGATFYFSLPVTSPTPRA